MNRRQSLAQAGAAPTDEQWETIAGRRADTGPSWLLVVASTGIVCRPGCPARTPGRGQVRIVADLGEALAAGARPCLRCHPERTDGQASGVVASELEAVAAAVGRLSAALDADEELPSDVDLARDAGLSERRLRQAFRTALGVTPRGWISARRAERLRAHLNGRSRVVDAIFEAGYGSSSTAYEAAGGALGNGAGAVSRRGSGGAHSLDHGCHTGWPGAGRGHRSRPVRRSSG